MKRVAALTFILLLPVTFVAQSAQAQQQRMCGKRASIVKVLADKYKEALVATGLASTKMAMEIYASEKGTWTVLLTMTNGITCMMSSGNNWSQRMLKKGEPL